MQHVLRHAGLVQQPDGTVGNQRRRRGWLGQHGVAGGERGRDLARVNRQREVPWADRDEHAFAAHHVGVALAGRPGQQDRLAEVLLRLRAVVAHEVDGLAQLRDRVRDRAAAFANDQ